MNIINNKKTYTFVLAFIVMSVAFVVAPTSVKAGEWYDPFCMWSGCDDEPSTVNYTNSNNVNSNVNSPGGVVVADNYNSNVGTPVYSYNNTPSNNYPTLKATCYPMPPQAETGDLVVWGSSVYGGTGSYHITWTGSDGLSGNGDTVSKRYYDDGIKNATITVRSGSQTISRNCDSSVRIYDNGDYDDDYDYDYDDDYYGSLRVSCSPNRTNGYDGTTITWTAYPTGGTGSYSYDWTGSDGLDGSSRSIRKTYYNDGDKYARVTVRSGGRSITERCDDEVSIDDRNEDIRYYNTPVYTAPVVRDGLDIGCFADPATTRVNQPVTWSAEVVGGYAPYTYSWSGSDGLVGTSASAIKYYSTIGEKNAIVTVTSADGKTGTRSCTNTVTVRSASSGTSNGSTNVDKSTDDSNGLSASALFSLKNVPWGWVAVLIILVLFATVMYLLFNRTKI